MHAVPVGQVAGGAARGAAAERVTAVGAGQSVECGVHHTTRQGWRSGSSATISASAAFPALAVRPSGAERTAMCRPRCRPPGHGRSTGSAGRRPAVLVSAALCTAAQYGPDRRPRHAPSPLRARCCLSLFALRRPRAAASRPRPVTAPAAASSRPGPRPSGSPWRPGPGCCVPPPPCSRPGPRRWRPRAPPPCSRG